MNENLFIILLNYNGYKDTIDCVNSIKSSKKIEKYKIVVVDNKSTDESIKYLEKIEGIILLKASENKGFANGNNIGIKYALENDADFILLLNNDTIIDNNALFVMMQRIQKSNDVGILGSRIMYYDNRDKINYCGGDINWFKGVSKHNYYKETYNNKLPEFFYTNFITGCCMLIKREVFENIGLLPEEYFMYYEDVDFCVKAINGGYKLGVESDSIVYHKVSSSSGGEDSPFSIKWMTRNRMIFIKKYKKNTYGFLTILFFYITRFLKIIKCLFENNKSIKNALIEGMKMGRKYIKEKKI